MLGLEQDSIDRYNRFIETVKKERLVWGLMSESGWATAPSNIYEDTTVIPFWSHKAYAQRVAKKEWQAYKPTSISLDEFIDSWLKGMDENGNMVGVNWNAHLIGKEVEPKDLAKDLLSK